MYRLLIILIAFCASCSQPNTNKPVITTSIAPYAQYLQQIVGDKYNVVNITKNTATAEDIDLTLEQIQEITASELYFSFNLPFEEVMLSKHLVSKDKVISLPHAAEQYIFSQTTTMIEGSTAHDDEDHDPKNLDPHIWVSPKQMLAVLKFSLNEIIAIHPEYKKELTNNFMQVQDSLNQLDISIKQTVKKLGNKQFLVFHPAYGYLAKDYNLTQIAIEKNGKETSLKEMSDVITLIKKDKIPVLFLQTAYREDIVESIHNETGVKIVRVNPLDEDYKKQIDLLIGGLQR